MKKVDFLELVKKNKAAFEEIEERYEKKGFRNIRMVMDQDENAPDSGCVIDLFVDTDPEFDLGELASYQSEIKDLLHFDGINIVSKQSLPEDLQFLADGEA